MSRRTLRNSLTCRFFWGMRLRRSGSKRRRDAAATAMMATMTEAAIMRPLRRDKSGPARRGACPSKGGELKHAHEVESRIDRASAARARLRPRGAADGGEGARGAGALHGAEGAGLRRGAAAGVGEGSGE